MKFSEIVSRLTGISSPIFGVSWNPPQAEVSVARRVITFLEDRRVLYVDGEMEMPDHCVSSVIEIRRYLTTELQQLSDGELSSSLRAMRAACRKFLDKSNGVGRHGGHWGYSSGWRFNSALGELRGVFGVHLAKLAAQHGLDVEDDLAQILPESDSSANEEDRKRPKRDE